MRIEFHPDTVADLNDSIEFYERQQVGLGAELRVEYTKPLTESWPTLICFVLLEQIFGAVWHTASHSLFCIVSLAPTRFAYW